jgi:superfamily I DNA/RNA helicase
MYDLGSLNPQQRLAVETTDGPVLILAGAGTGKTRVITTRVAYLLAQGVPAANILAVTFTNKAAREMLERLEQIRPRQLPAAGGKQADRPTICTFHSFGVRLLRRHIERLGYKKNFVIYDESDQVSVIKRILGQLHPQVAGVDPRLVAACLERYKNKGLRPGGALSDEQKAVVNRVMERYAQALLACNAVDFDDLILLPLRLFREHPEVLAACRARYRYVMVDEYQDTNRPQFELVHALASEHRNLCVVGDDDQSIYGWRGAEARNLLDMEAHFPEVKVIKLEQNYRSTNVILQAANALIKNNARRRAKRLWSERGRGAKILFYELETEEEEARTVAERLQCARHLRGIPWSAQAVLFRTNGQSQPFEAELRKARIPYRVVGGQSFYDRREVRDFLAYIKTLVNPHDDASLLRIANVPARGLSEPTMQRLLAASRQGGCSVFTAMGQPELGETFQERTKNSIRAFVDLVRSERSALAQVRSPQDQPALRKWAEAFLTRLGYQEELCRLEKHRDTAENRLQHLTRLMDTMDSRAPAAGPLLDRLEGFLDDTALDTDQEDDDEKPGDRVTLITMHSCKGLEFPHVYVAGLEDGLVPHARSKEDGLSEEERRLFYVSVTRAMQTLTLSCCRFRKKHGKLVPCHPSPFLKELPSELVERASDKPPERVTPAQGAEWFAAIKSDLDD